MARNARSIITDVTQPENQPITYPDDVPMVEAGPVETSPSGPVETSPSGPVETSPSGPKKRGRKTGAKKTPAYTPEEKALFKQGLLELRAKCVEEAARITAAIDAL